MPPLVWDIWHGGHKLLYRNCIEILMKLMELDLIKVVYTLNAREFVTPEQLKLEIQDEVSP